MRWHAEDLFRKYTKVTIVKLNLFPVWVTWERQRAFLMCPAASLPPRSVCHFVRPHKNATRSCVEEEGKGYRVSDGYSWSQSFYIEVFLFHSEGPESSRLLVDLVGRLQSLGMVTARGKAGRRTNWKWEEEVVSDWWVGICTRRHVTVKHPLEFGARLWTICFLIVPDVLASVPVWILEPNINTFYRALITMSTYFPDILTVFFFHWVSASRCFSSLL